MVVLEANVDDLDPRVWPTVLAALMEAGAADAWLTPILMKKGRPAHTLSVLADPELAPALRDRVLRAHQHDRCPAVRPSTGGRWSAGWADVDRRRGPVAVKVAHRDGVVVHATPEFEDVSALAAELDRPVQTVLAAAVAAAEHAGLTAGGDVPVICARRLDGRAGQPRDATRPHPAAAADPGQRYSGAAIWAARWPAPYPLSMLTTATPGAQALSMASNAASPSKAAP